MPEHRSKNAENFEANSEVSSAPGHVSRRQFIAGTAAGVNALLLQCTASGMENKQEEQEALQPETFSTLKEWYQSPVLTDETEGLYAKMKELGNLSTWETQFTRLRGAREETDLLARKTLRDIGNPLPAPVRHFLKDCKAHGVSRSFAYYFANCCQKHCAKYNFRTLPGKVSAGLFLINYLHENAGLDFCACDEALSEQLYEHEIEMGDSIFASIANICNEMGIYLNMRSNGAYPVSGGGKEHPNTLQCMRMNPFVRLQYSAVPMGLSASGTVAASNDGAWEMRNVFTQKQGRQLEERHSVPCEIRLQRRSGDRQCFSAPVDLALASDDCCVCDPETQTILQKNADGSYIFTEPDKTFDPADDRNMNIEWKKCSAEYFLHPWIFSQKGRM